jgi:DNA-directed RNA polymerase specialized sigma24 family protein
LRSRTIGHQNLGGQRPAVDDVASPAPGGTRIQVAGLEISLDQGTLAEANSVALAAMLLGRHTSPTQAAQRAGRMLRAPEALNSLVPIDRDMLAWRRFGQLARAEAAQVLGITPETGAKRSLRASMQLEDVLATMPVGRESP